MKKNMIIFILLFLLFSCKESKRNILSYHIWAVMDNSEELRRPSSELCAYRDSQVYVVIVVENHNNRTIYFPIDTIYRNSAEEYIDEKKYFKITYGNMKISVGPQFRYKKEYLCIKPNDSISIGLFLNKESLKKLAIHDMALIDFKKLSVNYLIDRGQGPWRGVNVCDSLTFIRNNNIYRRHSVGPLKLN